MMPCIKHEGDRIDSKKKAEEAGRGMEQSIYKQYMGAQAVELRSVVSLVY